MRQGRSLLQTAERVARLVLKNDMVVDGCGQLRRTAFAGTDARLAPSVPLRVPEVGEG